MGWWWTSRNSSDEFDVIYPYAEKIPQATVRALDGSGHLSSTGFPELVNDIKSL